MSPHIFPVNGCLATCTRILSENRPTYCSASNSRTHRRDPAARCLLFSCFLEGPGLAPSSHWNPREPGALAASQKSLRAFTGLSPLFSRTPLTTWMHHRGKRELQSHFRQTCSESHCTTPPADFNRCPTSFKRDHYQRSITPMVTTLIFKSASLSRCCPCCVGTTLYHWPVNETLSTDSTDQTLFPWCTLRSAFLLRLPLGNKTDRI